MSPKLAKKLGLPTRRADKSINMWFAKGELHGTKDVAFHMTLKRRTKEFVESYILHEIDMVDLILGGIFFKP